MGTRARVHTQWGGDQDVHMSLAEAVIVGLGRPDALNRERSSQNDVEQEISSNDEWRGHGDSIKGEIGRT